MAQRLQWRSGGGEQAWLALLVETFDTVSRDTGHSCDAATISALKSHLARPAAAAAARFVALH